MKILHSADFHLGIKDIRVIRGEKMLWSRAEEQKKNVRSMIGYAKKHKIEYIIVAGDIFDKSRPNSEDIKVFLQLCSYAKQRGITLIVIRGNHDIRLDQDILSAIRIVDSDYLKIIDRPRKMVLGNMNLILIPFAHDIDYDKIVKSNIDKKRFNIVVFHDEYFGCVTGSEEYMIAGRVNLIKQFPKIDLALGGHLHKGQNIIRDNDTKVMYPGSITTMNFGERDDRKSFIEISSPNETHLKTKIHNFDIYNWEQIDIFPPKIPSIPKNSILKLKIHLSKKQFKTFSLNSLTKKIGSKVPSSEILKTEFEITGNKKSGGKISLKKKAPIILFEEYLVKKKTSKKSIILLKKEISKFL